MTLRLSDFAVMPLQAFHQFSHPNTHLNRTGDGSVGSSGAAFLAATDISLNAPAASAAGLRRVSAAIAASLPLKNEVLTDKPVVSIPESTVLPNFDAEHGDCSCNCGCGRNTHITQSTYATRTTHRTASEDVH